MIEESKAIQRAEFGLLCSLRNRVQRPEPPKVDPPLRDGGGRGELVGQGVGPEQLELAARFDDANGAGLTRGQMVGQWSPDTFSRENGPRLVECLLLQYASSHSTSYPAYRPTGVIKRARKKYGVPRNPEPPAPLRTLFLAPFLA